MSLPLNIEPTQYQIYPKLKVLFTVLVYSKKVYRALDMSTDRGCIIVGQYLGHLYVVDNFQKQEVGYIPSENLKPTNLVHATEVKS